MTGLTRKTLNRAMISLCLAIRDYGGRGKGLDTYAQPKRFSAWLGRFFCSIKRLFHVKIVYFDGIVFLPCIQYTQSSAKNIVETTREQAHSGDHTSVTLPVDPHHIEDITG